MRVKKVAKAIPVITPERARRILSDMPKNQFFSVVFRKVDGTVRRAVGYKGKARGIPVHGTGESFSHALLTGRFKFVEVTPGGARYRQFDLTRLHRLRVQGTLYAIEH